MLMANAAIRITGKYRFTIPTLDQTGLRL